jgi:hypothetical protein
VSLAQAATYEAKSAEKSRQLSALQVGYWWRALPQKQHKKAAKAQRIVR